MTGTRVVISNDGEKPDWTDQIKHQITIYNHSDEISRTILYHIVNNYNNLDDVTIFLHKNPFIYLTYLIGEREITDAEKKIVCNKLNTEINHTSQFATFYQNIHNVKNGENGNDTSFYCREYFGENYDYFTVVKGSQYIVPRKNIQQRPLHFWQRLYDAISTQKINENIMEELWWLAFTNKIEPGFTTSIANYSLLNTPYINWKVKSFEEISKNGNTNLISQSGLPFGSQIYAVGDSHTIFFHNSPKIREHWGFCSRIPLTAYSLLKNPMNIYDIGTLLGGGHENYNIKAGDFVLFYYGFNDIQKQIYHHARHRWQEEITDLFTNYITLINNYRNTYHITPIIVSIYPNPHLDAKGTDTEGTCDERKMYTLYTNKLLTKLCTENNLKLLDLYDYITDENGFIKSEFTKDKIHLDYDNEILRITVEDIIDNLCRN